jgi:hypothetical protein
LLISCAYNDFPKFADCSKSGLDLTLTSKQDPSLCTAIDGRIEVRPSGGDGPYSFSLNGSAFQTSNTFSFLGPGNYVVVTNDTQNCTSTLQVSLQAPGSTLTGTAAVVPDSECLTDNGAVTVTALQGTAPYQYQFGTGTFGSQSSFTNLVAGTYTVTIKDATNCPAVVGVIVPHQSTGVSYALDIKPILQANCTLSGCHNGDLGGSRDWRNYDNVKTNAINIKTRTTNRSMPAGGLSLTPDQIKLIACWVDDGANNN